MSQRKIAGIGNEYSDEILFRAHINPHKKIGSLSKKEKTKLYNIAQDTLKRAIDAGPPYGKMNKSWLIAHRKDLICPKNKKHKLVKEKIAGRTAIFCPEHQK
jgi:formamidopyrimidine-DNA glycosylase